MISRTIYGFLFGIAALALLMVLAIPFYSERIPVLLSGYVQDRISAAGHEWPYLSTQGRDLTISGKAPTPDAHQEVVDIAKNTPGIRSVTDAITPRIISPYTLTMSWKDQQFNSAGFLPDEASLQETKQTLQQLFGEHSSNELQVGSGNPPGWRELSATLVQLLPAFEQVTVDMVDQELDMSGKIASGGERERLLELLAPFREQGYTLNLHIVAADAAAMRCQQQFNTLLKQSIAFASGKNIINPGSFNLLESLAETAMFCPDELITITGHTDNRGDPATNEKLSQQRAAAVATWLIRAGVSEQRITVIGQGAKFPVADNETEAGRAKNRRIEFKVGEQ